MKKPLASYLKAIPQDEIVDIVASLLRAGFDADEVRDALPILIDELLPLGAIPGVGPLLEAADGPIIKGIVNALWPLFRKKAEGKNKVARATIA